MVFFHRWMSELLSFCLFLGHWKARGIPGLDHWDCGEGSANSKDHWQTASHRSSSKGEGRGAVVKTSSKTTIQKSKPSPSLQRLQHPPPIKSPQFHKQEYLCPGAEIGLCLKHTSCIFVNQKLFFEGLPFVHYTERFDHDIALAKNTLKKAFRLPSQNLILFGLYLQHRTFALKEHSLPFAAKNIMRQ